MNVLCPVWEASFCLLPMIFHLINFAAYHLRFSRKKRKLFFRILTVLTSFDGLRLIRWGDLYCRLLQTGTKISNSACFQLSWPTAEVNSQIRLLLNSAGTEDAGQVFSTVTLSVLTKKAASKSLMNSYAGYSRKGQPLMILPRKMCPWWWATSTLTKEKSWATGPPTSCSAFYMVRKSWDPLGSPRFLLVRSTSHLCCWKNNVRLRYPAIPITHSWGRNLLLEKKTAKFGLCLGCAFFRQKINLIQAYHKACWQFNIFG